MSAFQITPLPPVSKCQHFRYPSPLKNADVLYGRPHRVYQVRVCRVITTTVCTDVVKTLHTVNESTLWTWGHFEGEKPTLKILLFSWVESIFQVFWKRFPKRYSESLWVKEGPQSVAKLQAVILGRLTHSTSLESPLWNILPTHKTGDRFSFCSLKKT